MGQSESRIFTFHSDDVTQNPERLVPSLMGFVRVRVCARAGSRVVDHSTFTLDIRHEQIFYVNLFIVSVNFLHYFNGPVPVLPRRPFF